jgi:4-amino-4-deoxy-L-arabinose transferase-like glycosyltransferase
MVPAALILIGKISFIYQKIRELNIQQYIIHHIIVSLAVLALYYVYITNPPTYATQKDIFYHPIMMVGLVPSVEIFSLLFSALFCYYLLCVSRISLIIIGIICGLAVLVKETNAILVIPFFFYIFLKERDFRKIKIIVASATISYSIQFLYNIIVYNKIIFANRQHQWSPARAEKWANYVESQYGFHLDKVKYLSIDYFMANINQIVENYWVLILSILFSYIYLAIRCRHRKYLHNYCLTVCILFVLIHACFIRIGATFRYLQAIFPQAIILILCAVQVLVGDAIRYWNNLVIFPKKSN